MGNPAGRRVSRDTAKDGRSRRAHGAMPVVRACRASARHRGVGAKAFWLLCRFCKVTRRKGGTLSGRYRSNGYVLKSRATLTLALSRRRGNRLGDAEDIRCPVYCATAPRRTRSGSSGRSPYTCNQRKSLSLIPAHFYAFFCDGLYWRLPVTDRGLVNVCSHAKRSCGVAAPQY